MDKTYFLKGLTRGTIIGVILYSLTIGITYLLEGCYKISSSADLGMCGVFTSWAMLFGLVWIGAGVILGPLIGLFHRHLRIVIPLIILTIVTALVVIFSLVVVYVN
ncbi:MAG: hypothetical protein A3E93_00045 [Candidatus Zambryskibacteria bacterium RIFCSPHIGHO2_12_FULL_43_12b]|nr:MAG: hypothetical protein A3E93_00045 [Candidatus Zambryskibacteria bacterium RIFCSPHIGHO2_12_FULL_43_12b]